LDKVVFFEIPVDDPGRARQFYGTAFGWKLSEVPEMHYTQISTVDADRPGIRGTPKEPGAINGGMVERRREEVQTPVVYIKVKDIDQSSTTIEKNGGKLLKPKTPVGDFGYAAYFMDTEGNTVGLWQSA
jgi:hypothetical protein